MYGYQSRKIKVKTSNVEEVSKISAVLYRQILRKALMYKLYLKTKINIKIQKMIRKTLFVLNIVQIICIHL